MNRACSELVRKGVVVRLEDGGEPGSRVIAHEFVDLRFADGYVERWIGMGWARQVPPVDAPMGELMTWADQLAQAFDGNLRYELRVDWKDAPPPEAFANIPTEVAVEWNATLPDDAFGDHH